MMTQIVYWFANGATGPNDTAHIPDRPYANSRSDSITVEISGTFSGANVVFEGKADSEGTTWFPLPAIYWSGGEPEIVTAATAAGDYAILGVEGMKVFRARLTALSSGAITIKGNCVSTGE